MTLLDFEQIMAAVIEAVPPTEQQGKRPNTFAVVSSRSDIEAANLNKTYRSARDGVFFIRDYTQSDYNLDSMIIKYPAVTMEALEGSGTLIDSKWSITLVCVDQLLQAPDLGADGRGIEQIESDTEYILFNVLRRAQQYRKFETAPNSGLFLWGIPSEVLTVYPTAIGGEYASSTITSGGRIYKFRPRENKDAAIGTAFKFELLLQPECAAWANQ